MNTTSEARQLTPPTRTSRLRRPTAQDARDYGIIVVFVTLFVVLSVSSPSFLSAMNLLNLLKQNSAVGITACAATVVIIAGGFDLSVGAIYFLGSVASAWLAVHVNVPLGLLGGVVLGGGLGLVNGLLTTKLNIHSFLATLATSLMFAGVGAAITKGFQISVPDASFSRLGTSGIGTVHWAVIIFAAVALVLHLVLSRTAFGRYVYAVGGNREAARNAGVRVGTVIVVTFVASGLAAALGGVIDASIVSSGGNDTGASLPLAAIAAVALGGTSIFGGLGSVWRTVLGVLLLAMISNGFDLLSVAGYYQDIFKGAIIVVAVAINSMAQRG
jgi:ribose transport system permease protein